MSIKKIFNRILIVIGIVICIIVLTWCIPNKISDLRWLRSPSAIRSSILKDVPLGTEFRLVETYFKNNFTIERSIDSVPTDAQGRPMGGKGYIQAYLGGFRIILRADVQAVAEFDNEGKLKQIIVNKWYDAL